MAEFGLSLTLWRWVLLGGITFGGPLACGTDNNTSANSTTNTVIMGSLTGTGTTSTPGEGTSSTSRTSASTASSNGSNSVSSSSNMTTSAVVGSLSAGGASTSATAGMGGSASAASLTNGGGAAGAGTATTTGTAGSGGTSTVPGRFLCPAGPFDAPEVTSSEVVCQDFELSYNWNEGPAWVASQGAFYFTNFDVRTPSGGDIIKFTPGEGCQRFIEGIGCNGLAPSNDGNLLAACQETRSVVQLDLETKEMSTIADNYMGTMLDTPNDLVQHSNGTIYFTNPLYELGGRPEGLGSAALLIDPQGTVSLIQTGNCNGIALSPEEDRLYVLQMGSWDLDDQGVPANERPMFTAGDGIAVDCAGNVYASGTIFTSEGDEIGSWGMGTNLAFGGEDGTTVLVAGPGEQLRLLTVTVPGPP